MTKIIKVKNPGGMFYGNTQGIGSRDFRYEIHDRDTGKTLASYPFNLGDDYKRLINLHKKRR